MDKDIGEPSGRFAFQGADCSGSVCSHEEDSANQLSHSELKAVLRGEISTL